MSTGDDDSFSSDSEDEFLTMPKDGSSGGGGNVDREALIRKKLLESFYGKSSVDDHDTNNNNNYKKSSATTNGGIQQAGQAPANDDTDDEDDYAFDDDDVDAKPAFKPSATPGSAEDLDSVHFNAPAHTERHVIHDSVHTLLETQEQLSCQVRTIDSSMQTLVYENYSRFIDATDAIRSIGTTVHAHEAGLTRLGDAMQTIHDQSHAIEHSLGTLRDTVVEKLRVKRLLTRLDTLLKLPRTLRDQIDMGKYRLATKSYLSAANILRKHSEGFESLKTIETDCHGILSTLLVDLKRKLIHWSGGVPSSTSYDMSETNEEDDDNNNNDGSAQANGEVDEDQDPPDPPKTVAEIFECAGTPILVLSASAASTTGDLSTTTSITAPIGDEFHPGLTAAQCKDMALSASLRLLERVLDAHHIELQEAQFSTTSATNASAAAIGPASSFDTATDLDGSARSLTSNAIGPSSSKLIPTNVLDSILEAATLYSISLGENDKKAEDERLTDFVSEAFSSFLTHVRGELLEQSALVMANANNNKKRTTKLGGEEGKAGATTPDINNNNNEDQDEETENKEEEAYEQISVAMMLLIQSVRQLASGLALPEVGVPLDMASLLVDQAIGLTEAMVRRRVDQKFYTLRFRVIKDCLEPLCRNAMEQQKDFRLGELEGGVKDPTRVLHVVQMASVALSDSLQLVDDTVRSILSTVLDNSSSSFSSSPDASMLKQAVETSTKRFAMWLANAMEVLAGCESSSRRCTIEAKLGDPAENYDETNSHDASGVVEVSDLRDDVSEVSDDQNAQHQQVEVALFDLVEELESPTLKDARSDMTLAIAEMCRVAERSVMENIDQSIAAHGGGGKQRRTKSLFPDTGGEGPVASNKNSENKSNPTAERFRLAASRVLGLYAVSRGSTAGWVVCRGLPEVASLEETEDMPEGPRPDVLRLLEVVKSTSYDCAALFGGSKRAGPIPSNLEDELMSGYYNSQQSSQGPGRSGLLLDVERMFAEQVVVYPHPSEYSDFTRNSVLAIVLKVAFKALVESARCCKFTAAGYRQCMVDMEFLKFMLPHYVTNDFLPEGSAARAVVLKLLSDAIGAAGERCIDFDSTTDEGVFDLTNQARSVIREFMETHGGPFGVVSKFVIPED